MRFVVKASGVPVGSYIARFGGVEDVDAKGEYGPGLRWQFEVASGPHKGAKTGRITGVEPRAKNACGKILAGLTGKATLSPEDEVEINDYIGNNYLIVVGATESGATRIESVSLPPT